MSPSYVIKDWLPVRNDGSEGIYLYGTAYSLARMTLAQRNDYRKLTTSADCHCGGIDYTVARITDIGDGGVIVITNMASTSIHGRVIEIVVELDDAMTVEQYHGSVLRHMVGSVDPAFPRFPDLSRDSLMRMLNEEVRLWKI